MVFSGSGPEVFSWWRFGGLSRRDFLRQTWNSSFDIDIFSKASEIAYSFLLAIFPLLLFTLTLCALFAAAETTLRQNLFLDLARILPPAAYGLVQHTMDEVLKNSGGGKLTIGFLLTLIAASGGVVQAMSSLNAAYELHDRRPWWKVRLIAAGITAATSLLLVFLLLAVIVGRHFVGRAVQDWGFSPLLIRVWEGLDWVVVAAFLLVLLGIINYFGPDLDERRWYWFTPGSLLSLFLWLVASLGLRLYVHYFNNFTKAYGSLGAVIILLLWFYVGGLATLIGGVVNGVIIRATVAYRQENSKTKLRQDPERLRAA
jgi:membrane protein